MVTVSDLQADVASRYARLGLPSWTRTRPRPARGLWEIRDEVEYERTRSETQP